jgi:hypothetical protein
MTSNQIKTWLQECKSNTHTHMKSSQPSQPPNMVSSTSIGLQSSIKKKLKIL